MAFKSDKQHKDNLSQMGRFGARFFLFLVLVFASLWLGFQHIYGFGVFFAVLIGGAIYLIPIALRVMRAFEANIED